MPLIHVLPSLRNKTHQVQDIAMGYDLAMATPMVGSWTVTIHAIRPFTIHGDLYYELAVSADEQPGEQVVVRVAAHAAGALAVGDRASITFLMGQVTSAQKLGA
jgi:hypothetical protein